MLLLYPMMANFVVMGCAMPFVYQPMPALHLGGTALMARLGFVGALCHIAAYRSGSAVVVAPMQYSADPLGGGLRLRLLRRDPEPRHRDRRRDHHRQRHLRRLPRGQRRRLADPARCSAPRPATSRAPTRASSAPAAVPPPRQRRRAPRAAPAEPQRESG